MSYRRDLKLLRRAQKQAKHQMRQLDKLEIAGLTAITLHTHTQRVTVALVPTSGILFIDALQQELRERRQALQAEAQQMLEAWLGDEQLRDQPAPATESPLT